MSSVLEVSRLHKSFGSFTAVNRISFSLGKGEVVGFLGPNGAGKTTTIQMLMGLTEPTGGSIRYFGKDFSENRAFCLSQINVSSAFNTLQGRITVYENLKVFAGLYNVVDPDRRIHELSEQLELKKILHQPYKDLSAGQKTRVNFVKSLLNKPKLLLMDEPTASLDPDIADKALTFIEGLRREHRVSILYTSHNMNEVTRICDRVIFLDKGTIVAEDTPLGLTKRIQKATLRLTFNGNRKPIMSYAAREGLSVTYPQRQIAEFTLKEEMIPKVIFGLSKEGLYMTDIDTQKPSLDQVFLDIARGGTHDTKDL